MPSLNVNEDGWPEVAEARSSRTGASRVPDADRHGLTHYTPDANRHAPRAHLQARSSTGSDR